jgi:hypothetical protein
MAQKYRFSQVRDKNGRRFRVILYTTIVKPTVCQDSLGTNVQGRRSRNANRRSRLRAGAGVGARAGAAGGRDAHAVREPMRDVAGTKTHLLRCRLILENIVSTKTGSGQT